MSLPHCLIVWLPSCIVGGIVRNCMISSDKNAS